MARCSTRAPVRRGVGDDRPRSGSRQGCRLLFARAGCPVEKPGPGSRTCRAGCPASAKRGAPLFGYFLSGKREKVTRPPQEDESFCLYNAHQLIAGTEPGPDISISLRPFAFEGLHYFSILIEEVHFRHAICRHFQHNALVAKCIHQSKCCSAISCAADPSTSVTTNVFLTIG